MSWDDSLGVPFLHPKRLKKTHHGNLLGLPPTQDAIVTSRTITITFLGSGNPELNLEKCHGGILGPGGGRSMESLCCATRISDERNRLAGASGLLLAVKGGKTEVIFVGRLGRIGGGPKNSEPLKKWGYN